MSQENTGNLAQGQPEPGLADPLRACFRFGVILIEAEKESVTLTGQAARILGLGPAPELRCPLATLPAPLQKVIQEILSSGQPFADRQIELAGPGAGALNVRLSALTIQAGTRKAAMALIVNDLAPAGELERKLRQLERLANVGTLSASMAHEIRNALVAVRTFTELLLEKNQQAEPALLVRREIERIDSIVSRMLRFSGPSRPGAAPFSLHETLEHSLRLVQPPLEAKAIVVNRLFHAAPDLVQGDDNQLQQAFLNLFLNALEAMEPQGTLTVATETAPPSSLPASSRAPPGSSPIGVTIQDTGAGVPPENLARLFEPFFTTKPNGTGLGLAITRRIILEHQGAISVQSRPGQGTVFKILLPAKTTSL
ncbi:MAG: ATP-binding protein [Verrucomicrobiota bacterium]|jgi:two-component system sensor histidine kinase HydH